MSTLDFEEAQSINILLVLICLDSQRVSQPSKLRHEVEDESSYSGERGMGGID